MKHIRRCAVIAFVIALVLCTLGFLTGTDIKTNPWIGYLIPFIALAISAGVTAVFAAIYFLFLAFVSYSSKIAQKERSAPPWFLPAGIIAVILGVLGFLASAAVGGGRDAADCLLAGLLNPLFFVGMPLGIYWLYRFGQNASLQPPSTIDEANPKLTHCPDCGKHVSRLATSCPHCGRPLIDNEQRKL